MEQKIKVLIAEDDLIYRIRLRKIIETNIPEAEIVGAAKDGSEAIRLILEHRPQLIFLDIDLKDMTGFDVLDQVADKVDFEVIFYTRYDNFAVKAFEIEAIDFILKTDDEGSRVRDSFLRFLSREQHAYKETRNLIATYEKITQNQQPETIVFKDQNGLSRCDLCNIIHLRASGSFTLVYLTESKNPIVVTKNIGTYNYLENFCFIRCHQSHIINIKQAKKYDSKNSMIVMKNGEEIPVSRKNRPKVAEKFKEC